MPLLHLISRMKRAEKLKRTWGKEYKVERDKNLGKGKRKSKPASRMSSVVGKRKGIRGSKGTKHEVRVRWRLSTEVRRSERITRGMTSWSELLWFPGTFLLLQVLSRFQLHALGCSPCAWLPSDHNTATFPNLNHFRSSVIHSIVWLDYIITSFKIIEIDNLIKKGNIHYNFVQFSSSVAVYHVL